LSRDKKTGGSQQLNWGKNPVSKLFSVTLFLILQAKADQRPPSPSKVLIATPTEPLHGDRNRREYPQLPVLPVALAGSATS